jgi:hypothetical protein
MRRFLIERAQDVIFLACAYGVLYFTAQAVLILRGAA